MEILLGSIVVFTVVSALLVVGQHVRRAPMSVGCTPVNGTCCRNPDGCTAASPGVARETAGRTKPLEVPHAGP